MSTSNVQLPDTIKAVVVTDNKSVKVTSIPFGTEDKVKNLSPNQVLIRVRSAGLNPTDWKSVEGYATPGAVSGCDSAGDVIQVGTAVKHLKPGDRAATFAFGASQPDNGSFAEYVRGDPVATLKLPEGMSHDEGAALPIPLYTAIQALYLRLGVPKPSTPSTKKEAILIWGGSTAVGHHAIQLAALSGLRVFVTASPAVHDEIKSLGATEVFDYRDENVVEKIKKAAGEPGIIYALDTVSEGGTIEKVVDAMGSSGGEVVTLLPPSEETRKRRADVKADFTLLYLVLGPFPKWNLPFWEHDREPLLDFATNELPSIFAGWKEGTGSPKYKPQKLRRMEGGLEKIEEGMKIMKQGAYGREKLVYPIA